ncbi:MAG: VOC family protein, partial [Solirubrobacterales bacterium]|nr:VOC family protein [Solirubrobacterales bacterium]
MQLDGIHHITCITADARGNVDFYARVLGLRLVKKTVNFDAPDVYHLYYGDDRGAPGSILTFFEFPDAARGRAGSGMIHRLRWRVASDEALGFWAERLAGEGVDFDESAGDQGSLAFRDPEGLG